VLLASLLQELWSLFQPVWALLSFLLIPFHALLRASLKPFPLSLVLHDLLLSSFLSFHHAFLPILFQPIIEELLHSLCFSRQF